MKKPIARGILAGALALPMVALAQHPMRDDQEEREAEHRPGGTPDYCLNTAALAKTIAEQRDKHVSLAVIEDCLNKTPTYTMDEYPNDISSTFRERFYMKTAAKNIYHWQQETPEMIYKLFYGDCRRDRWGYIPCTPMLNGKCE